MRILFVAPRFHTNQYPTSRALVDHGHEVFYLVQAVGTTEDHSIIKPTPMKLSLMGRLIKRHVNKKYDRPTAESKMIDHFVPSFFSVFKTIKSIKPDVVILRDRIPSTVLANLSCKLLGIKPVVLYNQNPLYSRRDKKPDLLHRIVFAMMPKVRFTISYIRNIYDLTEYRDDLYVKDHEYFVPYVCPLNDKARDRSYFGEDGTLRILCTGKFRPYKNHRVLVDAVDIMRRNGRLNKISVTVLGQMSCDEEKEYFNDLDAYIKEKGVDDVITLRSNIPYKEMAGLYQSHDVYTLTSLNELASISILEAMGNALVPVSTSSNGTACYITEGENGLIFRTNDPNSLAEKLCELSENRDRIPKMAASGYRYMQENCMFENYYKALCDLLENEFSLKLDAPK